MSSPKTVTLPYGLAHDIAEALKASEHDCEERNDSASARVVFELREKLEGKLVINEQFAYVVRYLEQELDEHDDRGDEVDEAEIRCLFNLALDAWNGGAR